LTVDDTHIEHMDVSGVRALLLGESGSKVLKCKFWLCFALLVLKYKF
jgi:hypothetical protein